MVREVWEISRKLDSYIQISLSVSQEMGVLFAKMDDAIPLYATLNNESAEISLFLDSRNHDKVEPSFGRFTRTMKGDTDIYHLEAEELVTEFQMFRKIVGVPSVVQGGFFLKSGHVYADFRFHHSVLPKISQIAQEITESRNRIRLSYLGRSQGLISTLESIDRRIPLSLISFSFTPGEGYIAPDEVYTNPVAEAKLFSSGMESEFDTVLYTPKANSSCNVVDPVGGIFESHYRTPFMKRLMERIKNEKMPIASVLGRYYRNRVENYLAVPSFMSDEILNLVFSTARDTGNSGIELGSYTPLSDYFESH